MHPLHRFGSIAAQGIKSLTAFNLPVKVRATLLFKQELNKNHLKKQPA